MIGKSIIILDDHPVYQAGLKLIIDQEAMMKVADICRTCDELFLALSIGPADILLIDCSRPEGESSIPELVHRLHQQIPDSALVLMGENESHQLMAEQCSEMIKGYLCKTLSAENIIKLLHRIRRKIDSEPNVISDKNDIMGLEKPFIKMPLSIKEKTVMEFLSRGLSVTQTAKQLNRSVKTISSQKRQAMRKLGIKRDREIYELNIRNL